MSTVLFYLFILFLLISVLECPFTFLSNRKQISYLQNVMLIYPFIEEEFQVHSFLYYHSWSGFKCIMRWWLLVNLLFYRWEALLVLIGWHTFFFSFSNCHLKHITFSRFMFPFLFCKQFRYLLNRLYVHCRMTFWLYFYYENAVYQIDDIGNKKHFVNISLVFLFFFVFVLFLFLFLFLF